MTSRHLTILVVATCLSLSGCAVSEGGPAEFSFERITISNPLTTSEDRLRCDLQLHDCIARKGHPVLAMVYFAGVRAFGWTTWNRR